MSMKMPPGETNEAEDLSSCDSSLGMDDPFDRDWLSEYLARTFAAAAQENLKHVIIDNNNYCTNENDHTSIPFTIVTWNIWFSNFEWRSRLEAVLYQTLVHSPDVFCFQEVTTEVHNVMCRCEYLRERYDPTEERLPHGYDVAIWVRRDSQHSRSMLRWQSCLSIPLNSIFGRRGLLIDLEVMKTLPNGDEMTRRARVVTAHLESGKEHTATRRAQLRNLFSVIWDKPWNHKTDNLQSDQKSQSADVSILVGDFNFDPSYPENEMIQTNCIDVWDVIKPANDYGYTEDTTLNKMRFEKHCGKHKHVRYDRIALMVEPQNFCCKCKPHRIELLGTEPIDRERRVWPSDHFGLISCIGLSNKLRGVGSFHVQKTNEVAVNDGYATP